MQSEHKLALTKNYVLLVNESPVDDILDKIIKKKNATYFNIKF
jgi:hypothetical protein